MAPALELFDSEFTGLAFLKMDLLGDWDFVGEAYFGAASSSILSCLSCPDLSMRPISISLVGTSTPTVGLISCCALRVTFFFLSGERLERFMAEAESFVTRPYLSPSRALLGGDTFSSDWITSPTSSSSTGLLVPGIVISSLTWSMAASLTSLVPVSDGFSSFFSSDGGTTGGYLGKIRLALFFD